MAKILAQIGGNKNPLICQLGTYENKKTFDIRKYFYNEKEKKYLPTRKGITLTDKTYSAIKNVLNEYDKAIDEWLKITETQTVADEVNTQIERQRQAMLLIKYSKQAFSREVSSWKSPCFFEVVAEGGHNKVVLNSNHIFQQYLKKNLSKIKESNSAQEREECLRNIDNLFDILLITFQKSKDLFNKSPVISPDILFDMLDFNWGTFITNYLEERK